MFAENEWACSVDQSAYGHEARKRTWLFYVGPQPPPMLDRREVPGRLYVASSPTTRRRRALGLPADTLRADLLDLTPEPFAEALVRLALRSS